MSDTFDLTPRGAFIKVFYGAGAGGQALLQPFNLPRGCSQVMFHGIGAGGGGGGGGTGSGANKGGGGGGASGAIHTCLAFRQILPDTIFVQVGTGGAGGAAQANGVTGQQSYVTVAPQTGVASYYLINAGGGGLGGAGAGTAGSAGAGPGGTTIGGANWTQIGAWQSFPGMNGGAGGLAAAGTNVQWGSIATIVCGGAGGGGSNSSNVDAHGGQCLGGGLIAGNNVGVSPGGAGPDGYFQWKPFAGVGGAGGGSNAAGTGGNGGNGGIGSGGGGGGSGGTAGGVGGRGGDGMVVIVLW